MIDKLDGLVDEIYTLNSKLILLIGPSQSGKTKLLRQLAERRKACVLTAGATLGRKLLTVPSTERRLLAPSLLKQLANEFVIEGLLLLDNLELLFDRTLQLSPLDLLKRCASAHRVVAVWPGELHEGRLSYAKIGHSEHQDYGIEGLVPFIVQ